MNIKPEGLTLPDCHCFKTKASVMNNEIDKATSSVCIEVAMTGIEMMICNTSRDYYIACIIGDVLAMLLKPHVNPSLQEKEFEEAYQRIRPLVIQRLHYTAGRMEQVGIKWK